jgi:hypothetical protein
MKTTNNNGTPQVARAYLGICVLPLGIFGAVSAVGDDDTDHHFRVSSSTFSHHGVLPISLISNLSNLKSLLETGAIVLKS